MCGEIKPWQRRHEVCVRMLSPQQPFNNATLNPYQSNINDASVVVPLMCTLDNVEEVWLNEYDIVLSSLSQPGELWRLNLGANNLPEFGSCNSAGEGAPLNITTVASGQTHYIYTRPRVIATGHGLNGRRTLNVSVTNEFGQPVKFESMTFYLTFVMRKPEWSPEQVMQNDRNLVEWWRSNNNVGRLVV
jgi:hypothetical protein